MNENLNMNIIVEHQPNQERLKQLGVEHWAIWMKEPSTFPAIYAEDEMFYILEGEAIITPESGEPVRMSEGDLVALPIGLSCTWEVTRDLKKHYCYQMLVKKQLSSEDLQALKILDYPTATKEVSDFSETYAARKTCYLLEGEVLLTPAWGEPALIQKGDLVTLFAGMSCHWSIRQAVKMHYFYPEQYID
ncbi:hypothetical protein LEP3755_50760 [Leptolyngbya sp. NIES-3755]|nr:hypothetical protein LEP3755_50760 [Leptolyngbya sp. NIES-3755]